jgi:hypothetical protein
VSAQAICPPGKVAIGGGAQFIDMATGSTRDGLLMSSLPMGGSAVTAPNGWLASGSTQYQASPGGLTISDHLVAYAVCAAEGPTPSTGLHPSTVTTTAQFPSPPMMHPYYLTAQTSCPSGQALSGGVRFADATGPKDGMVMSNLPDYTGTNPPTGWLASGSVQYSTFMGNSGADRIHVQAVCANVCAGDIQVSDIQANDIATTPPAVNAPAWSSVICPTGMVAISGGARFADSSGATADGALMLSMPLYVPGTPPTPPGPPTGWIAAGSTQYLGDGPNPGPSVRIVAYAVCAVVLP